MMRPAEIVNIDLPQILLMRNLNNNDDDGDDVNDDNEDADADA